ncbi:outer membrane beta-barrel protein [Novosphingobium profundi]|uniref:outer membrane beta-barrel protein n=1 Tax=Novosphingobium profundi TaxID=1774954 RepID=UPI001BDB641A|nr:outer membrane beta-barrel protein [Novosphingobium profundi]MBT0669512.1 outer membrane beta-barrel protein [Novosphingobium profundi]
MEQECRASRRTQGWHHQFEANGGASFRVAYGLGALALALAWQAPARAQTLDDNYWINVQAFYPRVDTQVRVTAKTETQIGTNIDLEKDLDLDRENVVPAVSIGSRFGHVVVGADYFRLKRSGEVGLQRDITFDDTTYPAEASVRSGFNSNIYRLTVGYAFIQKPDLEVGGAIGLHATNFRISISGEASVGGSSIDATTRVKKVFAPLPTVGLFATWKIAPRLEAAGRVDYLSLKVGDYDGKLVNVQAGVNYRVFDHVSLGIAYRYVDYRLGVDKEYWDGRVRYKLNGPALILQGSF